jgi:hypothetical protein
MSRAKSWCYTLNNPLTAEKALIANLWFDPDNKIVYHIFGNEVGESGTPHLQGFIVFSEEKRLSQVKHFFPRAHLEKRRGTFQEASDYCKKQGDFEEYGTLPHASQGKRTDWERLREHVQESGSRPSERSLRVLFPALMARYERGVWAYIDSLLPEVQLTDSTPRIGWQSELVNRLDGPADDRTIEFIVDPIGDHGKTWMCQYLLQSRDDVQLLRIGKRDDLSYAIDPNKRIFLFDVPRSQMEYLQYSVLESLKDRLIFSPKYNSCMKIVRQKCHVVVFCNEYPNPNALSADRVSVTQLTFVTIAG